MNQQFFKSLQKATLHRHLDGSVRLDTIYEIIHTQGIKTDHWDTAPTKEELKHMICAGPHTTSLLEYLAAFDIIVACMQTKENLIRIAKEGVEDAIADGIVHVELRWAPIQHTSVLTFQEASQIVRDAVAEAAKDLDVSAAVIVCHLKHLKVSDATLAAQQLGGANAAFDLAGPETPPLAKPFHAFQEAIDMAKGRLTLHAGEADGAANVQAALDAGARRIGHGVRSREIPAVVERLAREHACLEMCPTSNVHTKVAGIASDLSNYPLREYLQAGVAVSLSTDNATVSDVTLSEDYCRITAALGLSPAELLAVLDCGFKHGFDVRAGLRESALQHNFDKLKAFDEELLAHARPVFETIGSAAVLAQLK